MMPRSSDSFPLNCLPLDSGYQERHLQFSRERHQDIQACLSRECEDIDRLDLEMAEQEKRLVFLLNRKMQTLWVQSLVFQSAVASNISKIGDCPLRDQLRHLHTLFQGVNSCLYQVIHTDSEEQARSLLQLGCDLMHLVQLTGQVQLPDIHEI